MAEIDKVIEKRLRRMQVRMRYKMLLRMDSNGDGVIDEEEFSKKPMRMFERADADGDGQVTKQEVKKLMKKGHGYKKYKKNKGMGKKGMMGQGMGKKGMDEGMNKKMEKDKKATN